MNALKNWKIQNIALLLLVASGFILTVVAAFVDYQIHRKVMMKGIDDRLYAAATFAEQILPDDYHDRIVDKNSLPPEEFTRTVDRYNQLCEELGLQYLWSLMLVNGHPVFTTSTSPDKIEPNGKHAKFFEKHSNPELYEQAFSTMQPQFQINHDKWGTVRAALIPRVDSSGRKYLFGASMTVSVVETYISNLWKYSLIMITLFLPAALFMVFLSRRLSTPIKLLADAAEQVGSGDYISPIHICGAREINVVSDQLEIMRNSVLKHVTQLDNSMTELRSFEQIISSSPVIVYRLRMEPGSWPVEFISENISLIGYSAESLLSGKTSWYDINYPDDIPMIEEQIENFIHEGAEDFYIESRLITADGSIRHMESWNRFVRDPSSNEITHIYGLLKDITALTKTKKNEAHYYQALKETNADLQAFESVVNASPFTAFKLNVQNNFNAEFVSENISKIGYNAMDFMSGRKEFASIVPQESLEQLRSRFIEAAKAGEDTYSLETTIRCADGTIRPYLNSYRIIRNKEGTPLYLQGLSADITEEKKSKEREKAYLKQIQQKVNELENIHRVVTNSSIHIYRVKLDADLTTEFITDNYTRMGYNPDDIRSGKIKWRDIIHPDDFPLAEKAMEESLRNGTDNYTIESRLIWANGDIHWYRTWNQLMRDDQNNIHTLQGIAMDITGLKNAHAETLKHQQILKETIADLNQFYQLITASPVIAFRVKIEENFPPAMLTSNFADTGYTADELLNGLVEWADIIPNEDFLMIQKTILENTAKNIDKYSIEFRMRWKNGEIHWYHTWHNTVRDKHGTATHVQGLVSEITELKRAHARDLKYQTRLKHLAQELVQAEDKERRDLAYILHDDIGQMLAGLNMKLSVLQEASKEDADQLFPQVTELLSRIMKTTKSLTWEISPTSLYETDIAAGIERMAADLQKFFDLDISIETAGVRIELDRETAALIFRMAKELLVNIAKHSGTKSADIGISQYNNKVHMVVSDPGTGFDPEKLAAGKGYGLFSIKERLEHINGSMHIDSVPGKGTQILMIIPRDFSTIS